LADLCDWGSPTANGVIGDVEAEVVAYCSKAGHGTRIMPPGTITGAQFMKTSAYIQVTGNFHQSGIGLQTSDSGGELDPHGADLAGNPLGGLVYTNNFPSAKDNTTLIQANSWNNFVGGGQFCIKLCDPTVTSPNYCLNIYDQIGCAYNMPASYADKEFTSCEGELQDVVGVYTSGGQTLTWSQPANVPNSLPWQPRIPASSNCVTYSSEELFAPTSTASPTTTNSAPSSTGSKASSSTATAAGSAKTNGAERPVISTGLFALLGAVAMLM